MKKATLYTLCLLLLAGCANLFNETPVSKPPHFLKENTHADLIWSKTGVNIFISDMPMLVGAPDRILALQIQPNKLFAYDSVTGETVWENAGNFPYIMAVNNSVIYTTLLSNLYSYDTVDGSNLWNAQLPYAGTLYSLHFFEDKIFANSSNETLFVLDDNGNLLKSMGPGLYPIPYLISDVTYAIGNGLLALENETGNMLWQVDFDEEGVYTGPYFANDAIYVRTGSAVVPGDVYAIDKATGKLMWEYDTDAISNVCLLGSNLYFLTANGNLLALDRKNGREVAKLEFSPHFFILPTAGLYLGGYYVAADAENNILAVSLGDSYQLLALRIKNE